jgi:alpha-tubulin suppressor-like RCC1 family protein
MNISNLQILLQESIDNSTKTIDQLFLARAIEKLNMGQIRAVATYAELPAAASNEGLLVFVEADERIYFSNGQAWYNLIDEGKGLLYGWGSNFGRLGDNTTATRASPVSVVGGFTDWCQVSAGGAHSVGLRTNGTAWAWGDNSSGRLGTNNTTCYSSPVSVVGGFTDWCQVSAGWCHVLAIRTSGTLWAWGNNGSGQLGDCTVIAKSSPVSVVGGFTDWCQVSAGTFHTLAVRTNGTLWAWGCNGNGRLGTNNTTTYSSPVSVVGGFTDWCQVSAGRWHSLGIRTNGTLWSWGNNPVGQLGTNNTTTYSSPVSVVGGFTDWCQVATSLWCSILFSNVSHTLGVRSNGTLWAWGCNACGLLGDNTTTDRASPVSVVGGFTDWCQAATQTFSSHGLRMNGTIWAWGSNCSCSLGDNSFSDRSSPVSIVGGFTDWCQISSGGNHSLAIRRANFL